MLDLDFQNYIDKMMAAENKVWTIITTLYYAP